MNAKAPAPWPRGALWILTATIVASSMAFIDMTVVNIALPVLQRRLGASFVEAQWVVEAYTLFLSALVLPGGALGISMAGAGSSPSASCSSPLPRLPAAWRPIR